MRSSEHQELAVSAAREAGRVLLHRFEHGAGIESAQGRDIKTKADREAEAVILDLLEPTGLPILSEERGADDGFDLQGTGWIIDPLDGTMNLARGIPLCCVSIALWSGGKAILGVIEDFVHGRTWIGRPGEGATVDGVVMTCGSASDPSQAVLATGFPRARSFDGASIQAFLTQVQAYKKIRMIGSAALSLALVADGAMDLYLEEDIFLWDIAAGLALVEAAGGRAVHTEIDARWRTTVWAGAPALVERETSIMRGSA